MSGRAAASYCAARGGGDRRRSVEGAVLPQGRFHGPGHEEAWGVFDTGAFVGAFGARRQ